MVWGDGALPEAPAGLRNHFASTVTLSLPPGAGMMPCKVADSTVG